MGGLLSCWRPGRAAAEARRLPDAELAAATLGRDFSFSCIGVPAKVVEVYDGDTVRLVFRHRGALVQVRARLEGYDSPETRPALTAPARETEKAAALAARAALEAQLRPDWLVTADLSGFDKYGRVLATLRRGGVCLNAWMVANGHGVAYAGGARAPWSARALATCAALPAKRR